MLPAQSRQVFVDTNHLINLAHVGQGRPLRNQSAERTRAYERLLEIIRSGRCAPLFYEPSAYEWVHGNSLESALEIADVIDRAGPAKCVVHDPVVFLVEAMLECNRLDPRIPVPDVAIVHDLGRGNELGGWFRSLWPREDELPEITPVVVERPGGPPSVVGLVRALHGRVNGSPEMWQMALEGERFALEGTRGTLKQLGGRGPVPETVRRHWLRTAHLLDQVLRRVQPDCDADALIAGINLDACPSIQLKLDAYWCYAKANESPKPHDMIDLMMFAALPHADFALIENRMHEYARQARPGEAARRWFRDPGDLVAALSA